MTADERLELILLKVGRARLHIAEAERAVGAFRDTKPYEVGHKRDAQDRLIYYLTRVDTVPSAIATITGDAIQNLRSTLDHLVHQLFMVANPEKKPGRQLAFPTAISADNYRKNRDGRLEGIRQDAKDHINRIEPYGGGKGNELHTLSELNNIDKHRLLVAVGGSYQSFNAGAFMELPVIGDSLPPALDLFVGPANKLFPLKAGDELLIAGAEHQPNERVTFNLAVSLHEPGIIQDKPLLDMLHQFADAVTATVTQFKPYLD